MKQNEFEKFLDGAAREYNPPPPTPREEIWAGIQREMEPSERRDVLEIGQAGTRRRQQRREKLRRWTPWALGIAAAATLAVGFGLGRVSTEAGLTPGSESVAAAPDREPPSLPVRMAAADHMGEAEALLTMYRSGQREADRAATIRWARELLSGTRMMLDSRISEDPRMAALLSDLELVLVQIVSSDAGSIPEQDLIEEGIEERELMTKLRSIAAVPLEMSM